MNLNLIRNNLQARFDNEKAKNFNLWQKACGEFEEIINIIHDKYEPKRIIQWGSLLHPDKFNENSDIDIALEGIIDAEDYFAILGEAMKISSFPLDIVQLEKIEPEFAQIILEKGKVVFDSER